MKDTALTIVILTRDEEAHLPRCLDALPPRYPVVVLDSGSRDGTVAIARARGHTVYHRRWAGFAAQRNHALEHCGIESPWVLFIDADEVYPAEFFTWFESELVGHDGVDAVMVPSILYLRGERLSRAPGYPIYHPRVVRRERVRFLTNHTGHGEAVPRTAVTTTAPVGYAHYFYDGDLISWMHKHIDKAALEVNLQPTRDAHMTLRGRLSVLFGRNWLRIPARFAYHYVLRGGFLDGAAGLEFSLMFTWYEATIYVQAKSVRGETVQAPAAAVEKSRYR